MFAALLLVAALQDDPPRTQTNTLGMKLVRIEGGEFVMGSGEAPPRSKEEWAIRDYDEAPAHPVTISRTFFLGATEVTCAQYRAFDPAVKGVDEAPVVNLTWDQAVAFCTWLSKKEGKPYRLPTEAEWEYAAGPGEPPAHALLKGDKPLPAGSTPADARGLHEMHGNVAEWCHDWYGPYEAGAQRDPVGRADGIVRVTRGGHFLMGGARFGRSANRSGLLPEDANRATGFRVAMGELPATAPLPAADPPPFPEPGQPRPVPSTPIYQDYTREKKNPTIAKDAWGPLFSAWNHFAAVCVCPNGDVLAAWYTTVSEEGRELGQAASRLRRGADRWEPATSFLDVPDVNDHAPVLLTDGRRVYHFFTQSLRNWDEASDCVRHSDDSGRTWSKPRILLSRNDSKRMSQPCSAFVAKDGLLVLACDGDGHRDERVLLSADRGETWTLAKGDLRKEAGAYAIHPAVVPRDDGALLCFLRGPDPMPLLVSTDRGDTWEARSTSLPGIGVGQKAAALRLSSGAVLLVSFDSKKTLVGGGTFAALSFDDGKTWPQVRKVDGVTGYLAAAQSPEGMVYVVGSRMGAVAFNEAWLRESK